MSTSIQTIAKQSASSLRNVWALSEHQWCPIALTAKQKLFLDLPHLEVLYGGSAGSGKSSSELAGALQHVDVPNYSALILRRTFPELSQPGGLIDMAHEWLARTAAKWNDRDHRYSFPSGATITFGYLESERDRFRYQGSEHQYIAFDEVTAFDEDSYAYLFSRLRKRIDIPVPLRMRSGTNPGNIGMEWVKRRFIPEGFSTIDASTNLFVEKWGVDGAGMPVKRAFVPALLKDNPGLHSESYIESLAQLDPVTRAQLLAGDWQIQIKGDIFPSWDESRHVISWSQFRAVVDAPGIPENWLYGIGLDWGSTEDHPYVVSIVATAPENSPLKGKVFLHRAITGYSDPPRVVAEKILDALRQDRSFDRVYVWLMSHEAKSERDTFVMDYGLPFGPWKPDRTAGIAQIRDLLQIRGNAPDPFHPTLIGSPSFYCIVADDELAFPKTDAGLARHRLEFPLYHYDTTGQPYNKKLNDAMDSLRGVFSVFGPPIAPLTVEEELRQRIENFQPLSTGPMSAEQRAMAEMSRQYYLGEMVRDFKATQGFSHPLDVFKRRVLEGD